MTDKITIMVVNGVEGPSVYIGSMRVAGPKPWGGGPAIYTFKARRDAIERALKLEDTLKGAKP